MLVSTVWVVVLVACPRSNIQLAAAQGLPDDGGGVVGSADVTAALRATYRRASTWQTSYKLSPRAACSGSSSSLCAASDTQDELTIAELQLAATPSYYDARLPRFTGPFQAIAPPGDQGSCFTCATFSVIGAAEAAIASALRVNASSVQLSKQQLAYCLPSTTGLTRNCRTAWSLREAINALVAAFKGPRQLTTSSCLAYQNAAHVQQPSCKAACGPPDDDAAGLLNGAFTAQRLQTAWEMQRHITLHGAVISRLTVYSDLRPFFAANRTGVYPGPGRNANKTEDHAVLLVGFDNEGEYWIAKNSWGTAFADKGFFRIAFGVSGVGSFGDTYGLTWEPVMPHAQQAELTPVPSRPACFWYTGRPWDFVSRVANRFRLQIGRVLLDNRAVIPDPRQSLGGVELVLCDIEPGLVPPATELQALLQFKQQVDPDGRLEDWQQLVSGAPTNNTLPAHCRWMGVRCVNGIVRGIILQGSLGGVLPSAVTLAGLPALGILELLGAELSGTLPAGYAALQQLEQLSLSGCTFSGGIPDGWGTGYPNLVTLTLTNCKLSGTVPASLSQLPLLTTLNLTRNSLRGPLPSAWSQWGARIAYVDLSVNKLNSTLPAAWSAWTGLQTLSLGANWLVGTLPVSWGRMLALQALSLLGNQLNGTLPGAWGNGMAALNGIRLDYNRFTGTLPASWAAWSQLTMFGVTGNALTGTLPPEYGNWLALTGAGFGSNRLTGTLPATYGRWVRIMSFDCSANRLTGLLPASYATWRTAYAASFGDNQFDGTLPAAWGAMSSLYVLALISNKLKGMLPPEWAQMSRMNVLVLANNTLTGTLPPAWGRWKSLFILLAGTNRLSGTLPPEWADLPGLIVLDLSMNRLNGTLPAAWGRSASLQQVFLSDNNLSGTLPLTWRMPTIHVAWNVLTGPLPPSWAAAAILSLSGNRLSGSVPAAWGQKAALSSLSVNNNPDLEGCLPRAWRGRAGFRLSATQRNTPTVPYEPVARQARLDQARRAGPDDPPGGLRTSILTGMSSLDSGANGPAVPTNVALDGTRLTGYC